MATRLSVYDFMRDVNARTNTTGTIVYSATLNTDGTVKITRNGVTIWPKVFWYMGAGAAITDTNPNGDSISAWGSDSAMSRGDAQQFINSLN